MHADAPSRNSLLLTVLVVVHFRGGNVVGHFQRLVRLRGRRGHRVVMNAVTRQVGSGGASSLTHNKLGARRNDPPAAEQVDMAAMAAVVVVPVEVLLITYRLLRLLRCRRRCRCRRRRRRWFLLTAMSLLVQRVIFGRKVEL